jgi:hypothetical protein
LSRSLYSIMPPEASTSSPYGSNRVSELSEAGSADSEVSAVICRSLASTAICGPIVTAPVR